MTTLEKLDEFLKKKENSDTYLPLIRYFGGTCKFSTPSKQYEADTLEQSLELYLHDNTKQS